MLGYLLKRKQLSDSELFRLSDWILEHTLNYHLLCCGLAMKEAFICLFLEAISH